MNCDPCNYSCETCSGGNVNDCDSCDSNDKRTLNVNKCECDPGYAEEAQVCELCHYSCLTCSGIDVNECDTCDIAE